MFSIFSKQLLFIAVSTYLLSDINFESKKAPINQHDVKNEIVIIFKKNNAVETLNKFQNSVYFSENGHYILKDLTINNKTKDDTIKVASIQDRICLTHNFKDNATYMYEFQKGDTVVFDYSKNLPYATIKNRKSLKYDLNFQVDFKMEKPLSEFEFLSKFKRIRNATEKQDYLTELKNYSGKTDKALDSLLNGNLISKTVYELHKGRFKYYELNLNKDKFDVNSIAATDLQKDNLLYMKTYRYFLENFAVRKYNVKKINDFTYDYKEFYDKVSKSADFSPRAKEYLLFHSLNKIAENNSNSDLNAYFLKFQKDVSNADAVAYIKNTYLLDYSGLKTATNEVYLLNSEKQKFNIDELLAQHKGKVVYVDFWASWCAPCRAAMPFSRKLSHDYKEKDIVFLYISIDTDFEKWKSAYEKEGLAFNNNNVLAVNYLVALFYKELQLKTIPRYLIYNKEGKLVHQNAPSPDSNQIAEELDKYLRE